MKSLHIFAGITLAILLVISAAGDGLAGTRYRDKVFSSAAVTRNIQFGSNTNMDGSPAALYMDFYEPLNDTVKLRPLVICIHGGSLISGGRAEMDSYCTDLAERGYAAATIDYRIGIESPKGVRTILEALLRGVQDTKAAVRYFRSKAAQYGIDTSKIFLEGSSAGSMIAVHYAYWDEDEIPADVDQAKWGDINGTSGNPGYSTGIKGIINYCGAIVETKWIGAGGVPVANFHGLLDTIVPPDSAVSTDFGIVLHGGVAISRTATELGIYNQGAFFPQMGHGGNTDSLLVFAPNFLYTLMVLNSSGPTDFTSPELTERALRVFKYDNHTFETSALDKSGNRIILPASMIQYSCDSRIGTIQPNGVFTPADIPDSGYVYAKFNGTTDSCYVQTYDLKYFVISPKTAVTDTIQTLQLSIDTYDANSARINLPLTRFQFESTNPAVGTVDRYGIFKGKMNGTTEITATLSGYSDTCSITVESAGGIVSFDKFESLSGWTFTSENLDSLNVSLSTDQKSDGSSSFKIEYKYTYSAQKSSYMIYLNKDIPVFGLPDSIFLYVKSDGRNHKLFYRFEDADSGLFRASGKKYLNDSAAFDNVYAPMTGLVPVSGNPNLTYPLTLKRIEIQLAGVNGQGSPTTGTIYIDNMRLGNPGEVTGISERKHAPSVFSLEQNYPNPFNPSTIISFNLAKSGKVRLAIYDILGRQAAVLIDRELREGAHSVMFNPAGLPSGIYFYRLQAGEYSKVKKMVLLK